MGRERLRFWVWIGLALAAGTLLRLWYIAHPPMVAGDALVYGGIAKGLLTQGVYGFSHHTSNTGAVTVLPTLIRLPGYPLFDALCFKLFGIENYRAVLYVQLVADLATCMLCALLALRLFHRRAALAVLWIAALCPFTANYVATPITETLVLTTIALAFYSALRWNDAGGGFNRWLWITGAALAYSLLLRPDQGLLAVAVLPWMLWQSLSASQRNPAAWLRAATPTIAAALCVVLPLIPWAHRNWRAFHVFQPFVPRSATDPGETSPTDFNRWFRTWGVDFASTDQVYWNMDGATINPADLPNRAFALGCIAPRSVRREDLPLYGTTTALFDTYNQTAADSPEVEAAFRRLADARRHAAPFCTTVLLPLARLGNMLVRPRLELFPMPDAWWRRSVPARQRAFAVTWAALDIVYLIAAFAGLIAFFRRPARPRWATGLVCSMLAMILLRSALLLTLDNSEPRYTLEFFPIFFVWAGALFA